MRRVKFQQIKNAKIPNFIHQWKRAFKEYWPTKQSIDEETKKEGFIKYAKNVVLEPGQASLVKQRKVQNLLKAMLLHENKRHSKSFGKLFNNFILWPV